MDEIRKLLTENAVLPLWPEIGRILNLARGATYAAAERGDIKTIQIGRLKRVPTAWLRAKLEMEGANHERDGQRDANTPGSARRHG
jgi:hypothetical protein